MLVSIVIVWISPMQPFCAFVFILEVQYIYIYILEIIIRLFHQLEIIYLEKFHKTIIYISNQRFGGYLILLFMYFRSANCPPGNTGISSTIINTSSSAASSSSIISIISVS